MHPYRTHTCGALTKKNAGETVRLSGWIHRKRDHGGVLFIDLRDTYGVTQCVIDADSPLIKEAEKWRPESTVTITGRVKERREGTANKDLATGEIEVYIDEAAIQGSADVIPLQVADPDNAGEDVRLKYRYLDLRREGMHSRIRLRNNIIAGMRRRMWENGFQEFNTPIMTASSPEGARDYLVPSRLHPGKFYALPQAPQQFKQLLMVSGFDRYFQIAPCFRDEDGRADRLAEFYQLDVEMSFVTQEDVFATMEPVIGGVFEEFADWTGEKRTVTDWRKGGWPKIAYSDAMCYFGSDKPDLRNPLMIANVSAVFRSPDVNFNAFKSILDKGGVALAIKAPNVGQQPRSFFDKLNDWARGEGAPGLGYILFENGEGKGPIAKFVPQAMQHFATTMDHQFTNYIAADGSSNFTRFPPELIDRAREQFELQDGDALFFICDMPEKAYKFAGRARDAICSAIDNREKGAYKFCWIVDFPMYERDEATGKIDFSHNPFSMPQGGMSALEDQDPLTVFAFQYDCVCNGHELCSGAIRNHKAEIMEKAFAIAGYGKDVLEKKFGGMLNAFRFGAPPHGGCAFGIDRIVMILADEPNLREVYAFVMNGNYEDLMMGAPSEPSPEQLKDLHLKVVMPLKAAGEEEKKRA